MDAAGFIHNIKLVSVAARRIFSDHDERLAELEEGEGGGGGASVAIKSESGPIADPLRELVLGTGMTYEPLEDAGAVKINPLISLGVRGDEGEATAVGELEISGAKVEQSQEDLEGNIAHLVIGRALGVHQYEGGDVSKPEGENIEFGRLEAVVPEGRQARLEAHLTIEQNSAEPQVIEVAILSNGTEIALTNVIVPSEKRCLVELSALLLGGEWELDIIAINPPGSGFNLKAQSGGTSVANWAAVTLL